jgi:hypothetical protein
MRIDLSKYKTVKEKIAYLVANKSELMEFKKASFKTADAFGSNVIEVNAAKALNTHYKDEPATGVIKRTIIANTYNWLDSHGDVHVTNLFSKSISEREGRIWHLHDHEQKVTAKIGTPEKIYEKAVQWSNLGVNKFGYTEALFMDSNVKESLNKRMFKAYLENEVDQHSVGMQYVKMDLAVNDPEFKEEFATWNKYIDQIGNRADAEKQGYFWAIKEAKLIEISAVLEGSNTLTPTVQNITETAEPEKSTPKGSADANKSINYEYLLNNLK